MSRRNRQRTVAKTRRKPEALRPETKPAEPGENGQVVWLPQRVSGVRVTEHNALTYSAVFACIKVISEDLAKLPFRARRNRAGGQGSDLAADSVQDWLLHIEANPETSAFQWREVMVAWALSWGNGYAEIERDAAGRPLWLWQLTPDRVDPARDSRGRLVYDVANPGGPNTVLPAEDVFHLKGPGFDGLVGYSVIALAARAIGIGLALDLETASSAENESTPGGLLRYPHRLTKEARDNLQRSWTQRHQGLGRRRTVGILEEGMEWIQTGLPAKDMEVLNSRQFQPEEICRFFRVPPHKIASLMRATFSNIEHQGIDYYNDAMLPWGRRLECEADRKLFGRTNRGTMFTKINFNGLLRGDSASRADFFTKMIDRGIFSINDVLELEDMNPIGPDGDKRFVPVNMQLLEQVGLEKPEETDLADTGAGNLLTRVAVDVGAGKMTIGAAKVLVRVSFPGMTVEDFDAFFAELEKAPAPAPEPSAEESPASEEETPAPGEGLAAAMLPVLTDAWARIRRREAHRVKDALGRIGHNTEQYSAWLTEFAAEHRSYVLRTLNSPAVVLGKLLGVDVQTLLGLTADRHIAALLAESWLSPDGLPPDQWESTAPAEAEQLAKDIRLAATLERSTVANATG